MFFIGVPPKSKFSRFSNGKNYRDRSKHYDLYVTDASDIEINVLVLALVPWTAWQQNKILFPMTKETVQEQLLL
jgi:hypothetical protein